MIEPFIGAGVFFLLGIFIIILNLQEMLYEKRFLSGNVSVTKGQITKICRHSKRSGSSGAPIVWYTANVEYCVDGEIYRISGNDKCLKRKICVNTSTYQEGDIVDIAYRNDKRNDCIIKGNDYYKKGVFFILFGIVFIIIALIILFMSL